MGGPSWRRWGILGAALIVVGMASVPSGVRASTASQAGAYQVDPAHDGSQTDALAPPLTQVWSDAFGGPVSYPVMAGNLAFVTVATNPSTYGTTLYALNLGTGATVWSLPLGGTYWWSGLAYDNGQVFSLNYNGLLQGLNAGTGAVNWSLQLPGQTSFTSAPTAAGGYVYTGGAGSGGTVYAVSETNGQLAWSAPVANGDESSPVVTSSGVYVSYACQQTYDFAPTTGALIWHHAAGCEGGGGKTPALAPNGNLYVRDASLGDVILSGTTGNVAGTFAAGPIPAFDSTRAYFLSGGTLTASSLSGGTKQWTFTGDGSLSSAPLVANGVVYEGSTQGNLYALSATTGQTLWSGSAGSAIPAPDEQNVSQPLTGMAVAQGTLMVAAGSHLVVYRSVPAFSAAVAPTSLSIRHNHSGTATISITANQSFSGTVSLSATAPASDRAVVSPSSLTLRPGTTKSATLTVSATTVPRSFSVTVTACSGTTCHQNTLYVTVT